MADAGMTFDKVGTHADTVVGGVKNYDYVTLPSFDLGPLRLENKVASMTEDDNGTLTARKMMGFIGSSLFMQARVTLDLFNQRMYVEPPAQLAQAMKDKAPELFEGLADDKYQLPPGAGVPKPFGGPSGTPASGGDDKPEDSPAPPPDTQVPALPSGDTNQG
jgi:hypothetical protein